MEKRTVGRVFAGRHRPSMFLTLTLDSYGRVDADGAAVDPDRYDYRRATRDAIHFPALLDRFWQNTRRCVGWDVCQPTWEQACEELTEPAHVVRFGTQVHVKGILGGTEEAGRHVGYLTK
jgi:hypothetical protein